MHALENTIRIVEWHLKLKIIIYYIYIYIYIYIYLYIFLGIVIKGQEFVFIIAAYKS